MDSKKLQSIYNLAVLFEKQAQAISSAQSGDIETYLENARLWQLSSVVAPMLNQAGVPDDASVTIFILINKGPTVTFNSVLVPNNPKVSGRLNILLKQKLSVPMANALKMAKANITSPVTVKWLNF
jgi:hypothetical protein